MTAARITRLYNIYRMSVLFVRGYILYFLTIFGGGGVSIWRDRYIIILWVSIYYSYDLFSLRLDDAANRKIVLCARR